MCCGNLSQHVVHNQALRSESFVQSCISIQIFDGQNCSLFQYNEHFLKKIPAGAEASNILVGEVASMTSPIMAFVRLAKPVLLPELTEVPVPTRFIFILLGPAGHQQRYHEIGRSIATLMTDEVGAVDAMRKLYSCVHVL